MKVRLMRPCPVCGDMARLVPVQIVDAEEDYPPFGSAPEIVRVSACATCVASAGMLAPAGYPVAERSAMTRRARRDRFYDLAWSAAKSAAAIVG